MLKGTKFYSIARGKCPRCMDGDIYPVNNPYRLKNLTDLNTHCTHCKQNFEPEPNFYYGAMYVSYAYTVALFVAVYVFLGILLDWNMWSTIAALAIVLVVLAPVIFRISRTTWLSLFVKFDKEASKDHLKP
ncbi:DUF983 domain-containing protein [Schleiferiaceae bacterium]|nr:DUF983 domain-containing protein [Schleiferiaceae bacterium]